MKVWEHGSFLDQCECGRRIACCRTALAEQWKGSSTSWDLVPPRLCRPHLPVLLLLKTLGLKCGFSSSGLRHHSCKRSTPLEGMPRFCWTKTAMSFTEGTPFFPGLSVFLWDDVKKKKSNYFGSNTAHLQTRWFSLLLASESSSVPVIGLRSAANGALVCLSRKNLLKC